MRPELGRAAEEVIASIQREVPEYARPNDDTYTSTVRRAVHQAVQQFVLQIADPATSREGDRAAIPGHRADRGGRGTQPGAAPVRAATRGPGYLAHAV